jgi:hypothetical protein
MNELSDEVRKELRIAAEEVRLARKTLACKLETLTHLLRRAGITEDTVNARALDESTAHEHY